MERHSGGVYGLVTPPIWAFALVAFGALDLGVAVLAAAPGGASGANPVASAVGRHLGVAFLPLWKATALGVAYLAYRAAPFPYAVAVPVALGVSGTASVSWTLAAMTFAAA